MIDFNVKLTGREYDDLELYCERHGLDMSEFIRELIVSRTRDRVHFKDDLISVVCDVFDVEVKAVFSENRKRELVMARVVIGRLLRMNTKMTYSKIGELLNRDHSSVVYYVNLFEDEMQFNEWFKSKANEVCARMTVKGYKVVM